MAKHISLAKIMKRVARAANRTQSEAERERINGLNNPNGRLTYAHRMFHAAVSPGRHKCGCGVWISSNKSACLNCSKGAM